MSPGWERIERLMLGVAAVAGLATCLSVGAAKADQITFGPGNQDVTFISHAGNLTLGMPAETGPATFDGDTGTFTLGAPPGGAVYVLGNFNGTAFTSVTGPSEPYNYRANDGDTLSGNVTWTSVSGNNPNAITLFGTLLISSVSGDAAFTSDFRAGVSTSEQWSINGIGGLTLSQFGALPSALADGSASLGAIEPDPTPGPIVGAGIPGLLAALGSLVALAWRRRRSSLRAA